MAPLSFAFHVARLLLWGTASATTLKSLQRQQSGFISADVGDNVTLRCFYEGDAAAVFSWYKQTLGQEPKLISTFYKHDTRGTFNGAFRNNPRFSLESNDGKNHLTISDLQSSDSATYYCTSCYAFEFELQFGEGTTVSVKGSGPSIRALVQQPASETVQPGGSVTLNCTAHSGTCDGEHGVYWFESSEESHPGLVYTHGDRGAQCERKPNTQTHTCVYNQPMKSLNPSHAGTYHCAVAACGRVLFGELELAADEVTSPDILVNVLSGVLAFTTLLTVLMAFSVYELKKRGHCRCTEARATLPHPPTANSQVHHDADNLRHAALRRQRLNQARRQRGDGLTHCVHSGIRQQGWTGRNNICFQT